MLNNYLPSKFIKAKVTIPISTLLSSVLISTATFADDIAIGKYVGKWKDAGSFSGKFILVVENVSSEAIVGTLQFKSPPCKLPMPFSVTLTENNRIDVVIDSQSNCGNIHFLLDYQNNEFNGTFKDAYYSGKITGVKKQ